MGLFTRKYFETVDEAKEFLISRIEMEASLQGKALNEYERRALNYANDEPSTGWDIDWDQVRFSEMNDEGERFEKEMIQLLRSAYDRDLEQRSSDTPKYKSALSMFDESTNWICHIAQEAIHPTGGPRIFGFQVKS